MKLDTIASQLPISDNSMCSMDLEQVLSLTSLTHSQMFYLRQLLCYNLCVHVGDKTKVSCFCGIRVWSVPCFQKNESLPCGLITALAKAKTKWWYWFLSSDRDFAQIEKRKRVEKFLKIYLHLWRVQHLTIRLRSICYTSINILHSI